MGTDNCLLRRDALLGEFAEITAQIRDPSSTSQERVELLARIGVLRRIVLALGVEGTGELGPARSPNSFETAHWWVGQTEYLSR